MAYAPCNHSIISKLWTQWYNLRRSRLIGWLIVIIFFIILFVILQSLNVPLRNDSRRQSFLKRVPVEKTENFIIKLAAKYEKRNNQLDTSRLTEEESKNAILNMFKKADTNYDTKLDVMELTAIISEKVKDHLTLALKENFFIFAAVDQKPRNGAVSWDEYVHYFLRQHRFSDAEIEKYQSSRDGLTQELRVKLMKDQASFLTNARGDPERLTIDEFLSFRHPEASHQTILGYVDETLYKNDLNADGYLTEQEFSDPELNENGQEGESLEKYTKERIIEFRDALDKDKNGKVDRNELVQYFDPRHIHHSQKEARGLMHMGDINEDGVLSLAEILMHKENFMNSKLINVAKSFHDEF